MSGDPLFGCATMRACGRLFRCSIFNLEQIVIASALDAVLSFPTLSTQVYVNESIRPPSFTSAAVDVLVVDMSIG